MSLLIIIKTIFTMTKAGKILRGAGKLLKRVVLGGGDIIPLNLTANKAAPEGGKGKIDYVRLATSIIILVLTVGFLLGKLDIIELKSILELLK